jgi:hypothetical protein
VICQTKIPVNPTALSYTISLHVRASTSNQSLHRLSFSPSIRVDTSFLPDPYTTVSVIIHISLIEQN